MGGDVGKSPLACPPRAEAGRAKSLERKAPLEPRSFSEGASPLFGGGFATLLVYGTAHAVVDAVCAGVLFSMVSHKIISSQRLFSLILLYIFLAFALQPLFGFFIDYFKVPKLAAILGIIITGSSALIFTFAPLLATIVAGVGNALFHLGGGSIVLQLNPGKSTAPGIFVAPGAAGLFLGTLLGKAGHFSTLPFLVAVLILAALMSVIKVPAVVGMNTEKTDNKIEMVLVFVLLSVAIRSLIGFVLTFPWKSNLTLGLIFLAAVVLGKGVGGYLADIFGWKKVAVGSLVLSIPFLILGSSLPVAGIFGIFLFNITMPITLTAIAKVLPGWPAFAFGLTCLALAAGTLPLYFGLGPLFNGIVTIASTIIVSAAALFFGLQFLKNDFRYNFAAIWSKN